MQIRKAANLSGPVSCSGSIRTGQMHRGPSSQTKATERERTCLNRNLPASPLPLYVNADTREQQQMPCIGVVRDQAGFAQGAEILQGSISYSRGVQVWDFTRARRTSDGCGFQRGKGAG